MADYRSKDYSESQPAFGTPEWNECLRAHLLSALGSYGQLSAITINPFDVREHPLAHSSDKTRYYERLAADNQPFLPVVVAPRPEGGYVLLDGIHRLAVSQMLNKPLKALVASNQSLQKMAIKDIRLGTKLRPGDPRENPMGFHRYDYTHVLPSAHQAAGYKLNVYHDPEPGADNRFVKAVLTHPKGMTSKFYPGHVGHLSGEITPAGELHLDVAEIDKAHRGGKGLPLYEALMAHASKALGAHTVVGGEHSTMASGVHKKLSAKHGMGYTPTFRPEAAHTTPGEFDNKFGSYKYAIKSEKLDKGISSFVTAMMLAGHPGDYSAQQQPPPAEQATKPSATWTAEGLHEDLHPIAHLESSWGKNIVHKPGKDEMDTAHGAVGFKPQTAFETYSKSKLAQKKYPEASNPSSFLEKFKQDPEFYNSMASLHFDRLKKLHGSTDKAVYAWRHGSGAAEKASPEAIESEPYVQKYKALRGVKKLGKSQRDKETTKVVSVAAYKDGLLLFGLRDDKNKWCLPGGHMEPGEDRLEAAQRELLEETSLTGSNWEYLGSENIPSKGVIVYCYRCEVDGDPSPDKDPDSEFVQFQWADPDHIPEEIKANLYNNPDVNLDLQCINYSVEISKSEELEKGAMSRLFPYNPAIDSIAGKRSFNESKGRAHLADWQMWADPKDRQKIPQMKGNVMERGLHRLHGSTQVRRSPTGEREFLLHRSMNAEEFNKFHNQGVFSPDKNTSWAPSDNYGATYAAHTVSAWVPESSILSIPKQYGTLKYREPGRGIFDKLSNKYIQGGRNEMAPEHEVVLKPGSFQVHSTKTRKVEKTEELSKAARKPKFGPEQKNLVVTHNISEAGLEHAHKLGGLASPSLAVTHKDHPLKSFGNVTLVAPHHLADPSVHPVYDADIYSARHPRSEFKVNRKKLNALSSELDPHFKAIGSDYGSVMDSEFQRHGPKLAQESYNIARGLKHAWLKEKGVEIPDFKQEDNKIDRFKAADWIDAKTKELGEGDFHDWAEKKLEPLNEGQYIPKFSQSTGAKRQVPYTLDNILKEMKGNPRQGENFNYGLGSVRAGGAKKFKDIGQMRQHQGNIVSPEAFKKIKEDMGKRWDSLNEELKQYHGTKLKSPSDLGEAISNSYRRGKFLGNELSRAGFENVPPEMQSKVHDFAKDLVQMPTEYFEAKPQRVVGLNEFKGAAIPKDAHPRTIERLKSHGIQHIEHYDPDVEGDRARAINAIAQAQNLHLSEDLEKGTAFVTNNPNLNKVAQTPESIANRMTPHQVSGYESFDKIDSYKLPNGMYHHVYYKESSNPRHQSVHHSISNHDDPRVEGVATSSSSLYPSNATKEELLGGFDNKPWNDEKPMVIHGETSSRGPKGTGSLLYQEMAKVHGRMASDSSTSAGANGVWQKLVQNPEFKGQLGPDKNHRHYVEYLGQKPVPYRSIAGDGRSIDAQIKNPNPGYTFDIRSFKLDNSPPNMGYMEAAIMHNGQRVGYRGVHLDHETKKLHTVGPYYAQRGVAGGSYTDFGHDEARGMATKALENATGYKFAGDLPSEKAEQMMKSEDYRGVHKAPMNNGYHAPLHALNQIYPEDVYSPQAAQFYGHGEPKLDRETVKILHAAKGNPEHPVTMYRAIPKDIKATAIKPGDWVTTNANYAKLHGESALGGNYQIIKQVVPAKHLFTDANSIHEFGYDPGVPTHKTEEETSNFPKKCHNCGAVHTNEAWGNLPHVGNQNTEDETHNYTLEMRNCNCGSTLGIETATPKMGKSEELEKNRPGPKFPKLGVVDDRRETEQVTTPRQLKIKQLSHANAWTQEQFESPLRVHKDLRDVFGHLQTASKLADDTWLGPKNNFGKNEDWLADPTPGKRILALKNVNIPKERLWEALHDEHPEVRAFAAKHPGMTYEMLFQALAHADHHTRKQALSNPNITRDHLDFASGDPDLSESQELSKNIGFVEFPKLGTHIHTHPMQTDLAGAKDRKALMGDSKKTVSGGKMFYNMNVNPNKGLPGRQQKMSGFVMDDKSPNSLKGRGDHEAQHSVFAKLAQRHGLYAQHAAINHVLGGLSDHEKNFLFLLNPQLKNYPQGQRGEEVIAYMQNFLQEPERRKNQLQNFAPKGKRLSEAGQRKAHQLVKDMWKRMRTRAQEFGPEHIESYKASVTKSEKESIKEFLKSVNDSSSLGGIVEHMAGHSLLRKEVQKAAEFLAGAPSDPAIFREYFLETEDEFLAALVSVGMEPTEENLKSLKAVAKFEETEKAEVEKPKKINAIEPQGEKLAAEIQKGLDSGSAEVPDFKGKHTNGMWTVDGPDEETYLLKPGHGKLSPAKGIAQQKASPSQRETAFYEVAKELGLESFFVPTFLMALDGEQTVAMKLLPQEWQPLENMKFEDPSLPAHVLEKYRKNGDLHVWAVLDYVLGNADRHGSNLLVGPGEEDYPVVLIDHGTTFAGEKFAPGQDKNTFIPYYLRAWNQKSFKKSKDLEEKLKLMPVSTDEGRLAIGAFVQNLNPAQVESVLVRYQIDPEPIKQRIEKIKQLTHGQHPIDQALNLLWLGVI